MQQDRQRQSGERQPGKLQRPNGRRRRDRAGQRRLDGRPQGAGPALEPLTSGSGYFLPGTTGTTGFFGFFFSRLLRSWPLGMVFSSMVHFGKRPAIIR
jgi:hypothetical protein